MYSTSSGSNPSRGSLTEFTLWDIKGCWVSHDGLPDVRILRNRNCRNGGYHLEFTYRSGDSYRRPIKTMWGNVHYVDLYGFVGITYNPEHDVLQLSEYGDYYRAED